jgi:hypothetical protein
MVTARLREKGLWGQSPCPAGLCNTHHSVGFISSSLSIVQTLGLGCLFLLLKKKRGQYLKMRMFHITSSISSFSLKFRVTGLPPNMATSRGGSP